ncbi:hypothetical protein U8P68_27785 (plasmid) [Rhizobium ruizarguesonis]|nr:hypothetical protein U8P68_27785 [Rhizobium ruizarguesonis]
MARYDHLQLVRLPERFERRKHGGGSPPPNRDLAAHSAKLETELDAVIATQQRRRKAEFVDPSLILRVHMSGQLLEEQWEQLGLTVLSSDLDRSLVLFASTDEMQEFRRRLAAWKAGIPEGQKAPSYNGFIAAIEGIGAVEPRDRIGVRFREDGFIESTDFDDDTPYLVDLELWDLGERRLRERKLEQTEAYIETRDGEVLDRYIGPSIAMVRIRVSGALLKTLLAVEAVATIDQPPQPDVTTSEAYDLTLDNVPPLNGIAAMPHSSELSIVASTHIRSSMIFWSVRSAFPRAWDLLMTLATVRGLAGSPYSATCVRSLRPERLIVGRDFARQRWSMSTEHLTTAVLCRRRCGRLSPRLMSTTVAGSS